MSHWINSALRSRACRKTADRRVRFHPKVLIIEDERAIRRLVRVALENEGYRMFEAETGKTGLRTAAEQRMDVVILDLGLPDTNGLAWLQTFREWSQRR